MNQFPQTQLDGISVSRLVAGSNWFLGFAHQTKARTNWIVENQNAKKIGKILEVFLRSGVNIAMGTSEMLSEGVKIAQQKGEEGEFINDLLGMMQEIGIRNNA